MRKKQEVSYLEKKTETDKTLLLEKPHSNAHQYSIGYSGVLNQDFEDYFENNWKNNDAAMCENPTAGLSLAVLEKIVWPIKLDKSCGQVSRQNVCQNEMFFG